LSILNTSPVQIDPDRSPSNTRATIAARDVTPSLTKIRIRAIVEQAVGQYPDVNFIIPHLGSFADDWRAHVKVVDQIAAAGEALVLGHNLLRLIKHTRVSARL
jgi:hypothetical protein